MKHDPNLLHLSVSIYPCQFSYVPILTPCSFPLILQPSLKHTCIETQAASCEAFSSVFWHLLAYPVTTYSILFNSQVELRRTDNLLSKRLSLRAHPPCSSEHLAPRTGEEPQRLRIKQSTQIHWRSNKACSTARDAQLNSISNWAYL